MIGSFLPLLVLMIALAAIFRDDFSFTLVYLFAGSFILVTWWSRKSISAVRFQRSFTNRAFLGEWIKVNLEIKNEGFLPIPWIRIHEGLPVELSGPESFQRVFTLRPKSKKTLVYEIECRRRGYYPLGPIFITSSDVLGLSDKEHRREGEAAFLTVYPKIISLTQINFPSISPLGTLKHHQPIFEDPTRVIGKRDYVPGDSLRRIDWKATAATGRMQVKNFEPSIALETALFLNLNAADYYYRSRIASTELAIVIAASIANWVVSKGQSVGLYAHGLDPLNQGERVQFVPAGSGRGHLMKVLDILARVQVNEMVPFVDSIRNHRVMLPWGTTLTVITGEADDRLLEETYQARKAGLSVNVILAGPVKNQREISHHAGVYGIPVLNIVNERGMDVWRD